MTMMSVVSAVITVILKAQNAWIVVLTALSGWLEWLNPHVKANDKND